MTGRLRVAWRVWREGLPVVEVSHQLDRDRDVALVRIDYIGRCHGVVNGKEYWTNDGTFTVVQPFWRGR